ncbi:MAG: bifunctional diaminohydroxyphosphoribosylaminopyrimidine deaminase/5-amino-6-(5-phosphoribosylamino)uracil reductase RibD [Pikeienuella sp.]
MTGADARFLGAALALARRGLGRVAPNPSVGALLVKDGVILGRGVTLAGGRPHAETVALGRARARYGADALKGATAYVTLEPCAHHGLTPPCSDALIEAGIARLVCPVEDPDPRVHGRGFAKLRAAGVAVETGLLADAARLLNAGFFLRVERGRPWIQLKLAMTLDGRIATATGESRWITGPAARLRAHLMRAEADAVMIGAGTARTDDPMLDVRGFGAGVSQPVRVVMDPRLTLPMGHKLVATARRQPVWLLHGPSAGATPEAALAAEGCRPIAVPVGSDGRISLAPALQRLAGEGLTRVLVEGGGQLAAALLAEGLVDEIALFSAGAAIGSEGRPGIGALGLPRLAEAPRFRLVDSAAVGPDLLSVWRPASD